MSLPTRDEVNNAFEKANAVLRDVRPEYTRLGGVRLIRAGGPKGKNAIREDGVGKLVPITPDMVLFGETSHVIKAQKKAARAEFESICKTLCCDRRLLYGSNREYSIVETCKFSDRYADGLLELPGIMNHESFAFDQTESGKYRMLIVKSIPEFRATHMENASLRIKLAAAEARIKELEQAIPV